MCVLEKTATVGCDILSGAVIKPRSLNKTGRKGIIFTTYPEVRSIDGNRDILKKYDALPKMSQEAAANVLKIPRLSMRDILAKRGQVHISLVRVRVPSKYPASRLWDTGAQDIFHPKFISKNLPISLRH